jgi:hypothetical protein
MLLLQQLAPVYIVEYHNIENKKEELAFIEKYSKSTKVNIEAYVVSLEMKQAEYKILPWQKLKVFNKGKQKLEKLIEKNNENADLRYVRLVIQQHLPKLLNYNSEIKKDKQFLKELLEIKDSTDYLDLYIKNNTTL